VQPQAFEQAHAAAIKERRDDPVGAVHLPEDPPDFIACQDGRQADGALGADEVVEGREGFFEDVAVEKQEGAEGLVLRRSSEFGNPPEAPARGSAIDLDREPDSLAALSLPRREPPPSITSGDYSRRDQSGCEWRCGRGRGASAAGAGRERCRGMGSRRTFLIRLRYRTPGRRTLREAISPSVLKVELTERAVGNI
jgi:hypothetical protein